MLRRCAAAVAASGDKTWGGALPLVLGREVAERRLPNGEQASGIRRRCQRVVRPAQHSGPHSRVRRNERGGSEGSQGCRCPLLQD